MYVNIDFSLLKRFNTEIFLKFLVLISNTATFPCMYHVYTQYVNTYT